MKPPLLQVKLSAGYAKTMVLDNVAFSLHHGEAVGVVGISGAGKSTLLLALLGLLSTRGGWEKGSVRFEGTELVGLRQSMLRPYRGRAIAFIPQSPLGALSPVLSLYKHFREAWLAHSPADDAGMNLRMQEVLESVQLSCSPSFLSRRPAQISVGQAQRILIALAMLHRPALMIADEPTSALDPVARMEILRLLAGLRQSSATALLCISHDILSVLQLCDRIAVLDAGEIVEDLPAHQIANSNREVVQRLLQALPVPVEVLLHHLHVSAGSPVE